MFDHQTVAHPTKGIKPHCAKTAGQMAVRAQAIYATLIVYLIAIWLPAPLDIADSGATYNILTVFALSILIILYGRIPIYAIDRTDVLCLLLLLSIFSFLTLWSFITIPKLENPLRSGRPIFTYLQAVIVFFAVSSSISLKRLLSLTNIIILLAALISILSFLSRFDNDLGAIFYGTSDRSHAFFKHPNQLAIALNSVAPVALCLSFSKSRWRGLYAGATICILVGLITSGSKANVILFGLLSFIVFTASPFLTTSSVNRPLALVRNYFVLLILAVFSVWMLFELNPRALALLQQFLSPHESLASFEDRLALWRYSIQATFNNPILGEGAGRPIHAPDLNIPFVTHSHNVIIDHFRMLGIPGGVSITLALALVLRFLLRSIADCLRSKGNNLQLRLLVIGLSLGGIGYILSNLSSDSMGPSTSPFLWLVTCLSFIGRYYLNARASK